LKAVKFVELDVTKMDTILSARDTISAHTGGKLDVLVNNAAISNLGKDQNAKSVDIALVRETIEVNLYGLIETTKAFIPLLRQTTTEAPVILNVSTELASNSYQASTKAHINVVAYNTSKAAANSYTIALAHELKSEGFKVNAVTPGFTSTKLNFFAKGGKTPRHGAKVLLPYALLGKNSVTGLFICPTGEFPW
jgi:NAD(P)-dependent dehydrogenase (short-subunit alcohol dehydrogenase family)